MHVVFREAQGLEETDIPMDLGQSPADLVVLSFSDSDLGAFSEGWKKEKEGLPSLRLANLVALKHPLSVDTYIEQTLEKAKGILIRLIGGVQYWEYGLNQVYNLAQEKGIALAVLPADGREDDRLDEFSTIPKSTLLRLKNLTDTGGSKAAAAALAQLAISAGLYAAPIIGDKALPDVGYWLPKDGVVSEFSSHNKYQLICITFYRSFLASEDMAAIRQLSAAFDFLGYQVVGIFAPTLKNPEYGSWIQQAIKTLQPVAIINATSFSSKGSNGSSPLDVSKTPIFQVALSTSNKKNWVDACRGLSPTDLAMHVVLPEVDGKIFSGIISTKEATKRDPNLQYSRFVHTPLDERIRQVSAKVDKWIKLQSKYREKVVPKVAIVLSTYPGKKWQMAHAVGLDALASAAAVAADCSLTNSDLVDIPKRLENELILWPISSYKDALRNLPCNLKIMLEEAWGEPEDDPDVVDVCFKFPAFWQDSSLIVLQPERGRPNVRDEEYHDLGRTPRHSYVAFYLWLQNEGLDAVIHMGAHGTLEWLPGKSVALSDECWPDALAGSMPFIYPFIVNDPGEAATAKRRLGAVTLGHIPPPLRASGVPERYAGLEALLDEFSNADGLDPKRRERLKLDIYEAAQSLGIQADLGITGQMSEEEVLTRVDRFVCDIKESQFGEGLHIYGRCTNKQMDLTCAENERTGIVSALSGLRVEAGPAGSPYRGRTDVLPTGRNLFASDPLSLPTKAAYSHGKILADELIRRNLQDNGDWPQGLLVDLWGSATMRTAGEEFAMALALMGVKPLWREGSERVSGIEIVPIAELDRPRIDVTLRISGLFRDVFPTLSQLFNQAVGLLENREESMDWNPYVRHKNTTTARVYGPAPGQYGLDIGVSSDEYSDSARVEAGEMWIKNSSWAIDGDKAYPDESGIKDRVKKIDTFVHLQDLAETDVLMAADYAAHEGGFAAAKSNVGGMKASLYHIDATNPSAPKARKLKEEIAKTVMARAANTNWINGMRRHGYRGGAEIAATLDHMGSFANLANLVEGHLFDEYFLSTLGNEEVFKFLEEENPEALQAMIQRFKALQDSGLWVTRRNSIQAQLLAFRNDTPNLDYHS